MDLIKDEKLMWIPKKGRIAPLPENWEVYTGNHGEIIYRNFKTGVTQT